VQLIDTSSWQVIRTFEGHILAVTSVAFSPDGKHLASGSGDGTIKLWDVATRQEVRTLKGHTRGVTSVAFSPDGKLLASGSWDGTIKLWDISDLLGRRGPKRGHFNPKCQRERVPCLFSARIAVATRFFVAKLRRNL
jgi:WD40 repeat protein